MTMKSSLLIAGTLAFAGLAFAGPKSYEFSLSSPTSLGANDLKPGQYKIRVEGSQATVTDEQTKKSYTVPVKVEHNGQKFDQTTVQSTTKDGKDSVVQINLGGSDTKLEVGQ